VFKILSLLTFCFFFTGCAAPKKSPIWGSQPPTHLMPKFTFIQGTAIERLERAKFECQKLGDIYEAQLTWKDANDRSDAFLCAVKPQRNATSLELRVIQSRLFRTTSSDLVKAINTFMKDNNAICGTKYQFGMGNSVVYGGVGGGRLNDNEIECKNYNKRYIIELNQSPDSVVIRVRIYVYSVINPEVQLTDSKEYSKFFKHIADQLYIEDIQLNPAEMR